MITADKVDSGHSLVGRISCTIFGAGASANPTELDKTASLSSCLSGRKAVLAAVVLVQQGLGNFSLS